MGAKEPPNFPGEVVGSIDVSFQVSRNDQGSLMMESEAVDFSLMESAALDCLETGSLQWRPELHRHIGAGTYYVFPIIMLGELSMQHFLLVA